jgi:hypothetical protein
MHAPLERRQALARLHPTVARRCRTRHIDVVQGMCRTHGVVFRPDDLIPKLGPDFRVRRSGRDLGVRVLRGTIGSDIDRRTARDDDIEDVAGRLAVALLGMGRGGTLGGFLPAG